MFLLFFCTVSFVTCCLSLKLIVGLVTCDVQALNLGVIGPCLLDLEALAGLSGGGGGGGGGQLSTVFTVRGLLAICASVTLGPLLDRANHYLLVSVALHVDCIMYLAVTQCTSLTTLLITLAPPPVEYQPQLAGAKAGMSHLPGGR